MSVGDVLIPALLAGEVALERAAPALGSPRARAAVAIPLAAVALEFTSRGSPPEQVTKPPQPRAHAWPYAVPIGREASRWHLDPALIASVISQESAFRATAYNTVTGARGLMQLTPVTARALGVTKPNDAKQSIAAGSRYLRQLLDRFHGRLGLALAAYNAGPTAVDQFGRIPPYGETRRYVNAVLHRYARLRGAGSART